MVLTVNSLIYFLYAWQSGVGSCQSNSAFYGSHLAWPQGTAVLDTYGHSENTPATRTIETEHITPGPGDFVPFMTISDSLSWSCLASSKSHETLSYSHPRWEREHILSISARSQWLQLKIASTDTNKLLYWLGSSSLVHSSCCALGL